MEKKLQDYRARKRREAFLSSAKKSFSSIMFGGSSASTPCSTPPSSPERLTTDDRVNVQHVQF